MAESRGIEGEGIHTLEIAVRQHLFNVDDYPLFGLVRNIVADPRDVREQIDAWLHRTVQ